MFLSQRVHQVLNKIVDEAEQAEKTTEKAQAALKRQIDKIWEIELWDMGYTDGTGESGE